MKIVGTNNDSHCVYCNSTAYGPGCPYSPHKKHVHQDDFKRCVYCGSLLMGPGCPYNPFGKNHVHGVDYQQSLKEAVLNHLSVISFIQKLHEPVQDTEAYKLGLIDESYHRLRLPQTEIERNALSPFNNYIFKLRRMVGKHQLDLLNSNVVMEAIASYNNQKKFDVKQYESETKFKIVSKQIIENFKSLIRDAHESGLTLEQIETILLESLLDE